MSKPFEKPDRNEWLKDIQKYLKNDMTIDNLRVHNRGIILEPIYTTDDNVTDNFTPANISSVQNILWISDDTIEHNQHILKALLSGIEAIALDNISYNNIDKILAGVKLEFISLIIIQENPEEYDRFYDRFSETPQVNLYRRSIAIKGGNDVTAQIKAMIKNTQQAFIKYVPTVDFYRTIAELRAMKIILGRFDFQYHLAAAIKSEKINDIGDYDLIEATYKVMSSHMGNCDFISIESDDPEALRLGSNILNILNHESGFSTVADPVSGSYFIEEYTNKIVSQY